MQLPDLLLLVYKRTRNFYLKWRNHASRTRGASTTNIGIAIEENHTNREEGAFTAATNTTMETGTSRYTEDITKLRQDMERFLSIINTFNSSFKQDLEQQMDDKFNAMKREINETAQKVDKKIEKIIRKIEYYDGIIRGLSRK